MPNHGTSSFFARAGFSTRMLTLSCRHVQACLAAIALPALLAGGLAAATAAAGAPLARGRAPVNALLDSLRLNSNSARLEQMHLVATEIWKQDGGGVDRETDDVAFYHSVPLESEVRHNGAPLSADARAQQQRQVAALKEQIDSALAGDGDNTRLVNLDGEIWTLARFVAQFSWQAEAGSRPGTTVLKFMPRTRLASHSRVQTILRHTAGTFTVDTATGQLLDGEFHSTSHVSFGGGVLAHFSGFQGSFQLQSLDGCWVLRHIQVHVNGRRLFSSVHGTETITYAPAGDAKAAGDSSRR